MTVKHQRCLIEDKKDGVVGLIPRPQASNLVQFDEVAFDLPPMASWAAPLAAFASL